MKTNARTGDLLAELLPHEHSIIVCVLSLVSGSCPDTTDTVCVILSMM